MPRPIHAFIYPDALAHNIQVAKQYAPQSQVWAVIKADAYGHGIARVFTGLAQADGLAMLDFAEAAQVRALGWNRPILMLEGVFEAADYALAHAHHLTLVIHHSAQIEALEHYLARQPDAVFDVYLKLNTDMNRVGFDAVDLASSYQRLRGLPQVRHITLMTHFANADVAGGCQSAMTLFTAHTAAIRAREPAIACSLANSAAIVTQPDSHAQWVRAGIMIYGASPLATRSAVDLGLRPVMSLNSALIAVREIPAGAAVGYGSRYHAPQSRRIGVVACGYADGYPRHAPDGTPVVVGGVKTQLVGRVSMDMITVDITAIPHAQVGTPVQLWGDQLAVDEVASASGTIAYELLCALAPRVEKRIISD